MLPCNMPVPGFGPARAPGVVCRAPVVPGRPV